MTALALAYLAGLLTTLSPCVLPLIPLVLAGTWGGGRVGPVLFALGMVISFTAVGLFIASIGIGLGIDTHALRAAAAILLMGMGLALLFEPLQQRMALAAAGIASRTNQLANRLDAGKGASALILGGLAGALWSPCSGPSLGAAIALAAEAGGLGAAALRMLVFGLGAVTVLMLLAYGTRSAIAARRNGLLAAGSWLKPAAAGIFVIVGAAILTGMDKTAEAALAGITPDWLNDLTTLF
jgi:cytochrome c-type biogenesis protein